MASRSAHTDGSTPGHTGTHRRWRKALAALSRLKRNTEDTSQVFEILRALSGNTLERIRLRLRHSPEGRRILRERPDLSALLSDRGYLASLPAQSLGRAYLSFMASGELTPEGLQDADAEAVQRGSFERTPDQELQYIGQRLLAMHDLWHVLTGYGCDDTGELANLAFSYAQFGHPGMGLIALLGTLGGPPPLWRHNWAAYRRGRSARFLVMMPLERMLDWPLDQVRTLLDIDPPHKAHPAGVLTGDKLGDGIGLGPRTKATG